MGYIDQNLLSGESVVYRAKLHWIIFLWPAIFILIGIFSEQTRAFFLLIGFIWAISSYINYSSSEFGVTTRRVIVKVGLVRRRSLELLLSKVEGVGVDQGVLGRILGYGTIIVTGTGGTKEPFRSISAPLEFRRVVQQQSAGL